ncbi:double-stranded RNA-specific editase B2-like [Anopheles coustani]|uniref:double-stranded RNA-specific editase B2-like n=2 Tax=coustani group TaxID=59130 RepID=UPI0026588D89|nr:double-stranded RNA-specific editase B2-like [Anopheles coustani]
MEQEQQQSGSPNNREKKEEMSVPLFPVQQQSEQELSKFNIPIKQEDTDMANVPQDITSSEATFSKFRKHLLKKPGTSAERKKNEKERKARQMRRLRKWLIPKNAIVALHELQGPGMTEFVINTVGHLTKAEIVINNVKYEAVGSSKNQAKAKASEKALRDLAISQMNRLKQQQEAKAASKAVPPIAPPAPTMSETEPDGESSLHDSEMDVDDSGETDDLPMEHLAAFALHKLFSEWENEGFEVPTLKPQKPKLVAPPVETGIVGQPSMPKVTKTVADLPADAATRHPTELFAYMRPQVAYQDLGSNDDPLNREFTASISVEGKEFIGRGRSKKLARKAAAIDACKTLFGVEFDSSVLQA